MTRCRIGRKCEEAIPVWVENSWQGHVSDFQSEQYKGTEAQRGKTGGIAVDFGEGVDDNGVVVEKRFNHRPGDPANMYRYDSLDRLVHAQYHDAAPGSVTSGLAAHWPFEEGSGTTADDATANNHDGTISGAGWTPGKIGDYALEFDGINDDVTITGYKGIPGGASRSVAGWLKTEAPGGSIYTIIGWGEDDTGQAWLLFLDEYGGSDSRLAAAFWGDRTTDDAVLNDNQWHHVAGLYDSGSDTVALYVDGRQAAARSPGVTVDTSSAADVAIGQMLALGYYFDGAMDDLRIYDRALGEDEVSLLALGTGSEDFEYDWLGNRLSVIGRDGTLATYAVDESTNRYNATADGSHDVECLYDEAGNMVQDQNGYEFEYDYENRLVKVSKDSALIAAYVYDALGRRVIVDDAVADETTYYFYDGWRVLSETDDAGVTQKNYIYGNYLDEVLVISDDTDDMYCVQDHLYSVVALLDDSGDIIERYEYDAYGKLTVITAGNDDTYFTADDGTHTASTVGNPVTFTGQRFDPESGLMYYKRRTYNPYTGRFLQSDPLGTVPNAFKPNAFNARDQYTDGLNVYEYVKSEPLLKNDPHGLSFGAGTVEMAQYWASKRVDYCNIYVKRESFFKGVFHEWLEYDDGTTWGFNGGYGRSPDPISHSDDDAAIIWNVKRNKDGFLYSYNTPQKLGAK